MENKTNNFIDQFLYWYPFSDCVETENAKEIAFPAGVSE